MKTKSQLTKDLELLRNAELDHDDLDFRQIRKQYKKMAVALQHIENISPRVNCDGMIFYTSQKALQRFKTKLELEQQIE